MYRGLRSIVILAFGGWLSGYGGGSSDPPDLVVLVTIDTLRADHLEIYGYPRPTAPFLSTLADDGVVFENLQAPLTRRLRTPRSSQASIRPNTESCATECRSTAG